MCGEDIGIIKVKHSNLKGITISSSLSPMIIDEYPILAIAATQAKGKNYERFRRTKTQRK